MRKRFAMHADSSNPPGFRSIVTLEDTRNDFKRMNPADAGGANATADIITNFDTTAALQEKDEIFTWGRAAPQRSDSAPPQLEFAAPAIANCKLAGDYTDALTFRETVDDPESSLIANPDPDRGGDINF